MESIRDKTKTLKIERQEERSTKSSSVIECRQCGERLFMPEWSESLSGGRVRHLWRCDVCDYTFETTIRFAIPEYATD